MVKGILCQLVHYPIPLYATMAWHPAEADTSAFVAQCPEEIHDPANERVVSIFAFNYLQARHRFRVDYDIMLYRIHMPIIIQCQCDGGCLSSEDGTVIWESFGQLAASLTILEMAVDDRHCPHSLVNLRSVSIDFIMCSLSIVILSEFGLSLFSCDHTFARALNVSKPYSMLSWRHSWRIPSNICKHQNTHLKQGTALYLIIIYVHFGRPQLLAVYYPRYK